MTLPQIQQLSAEVLLAHFNEKESLVQQKEAEIQAQQVELEAQRTEIAQLLAQIDYLKRKLYGSGDGESTDKLQMELSELLSKLEPGTLQAPEPDSPSRSPGFTRQAQSPPALASALGALRTPAR